MRNLIKNLIGQKYGRLTIIKEVKPYIWNNRKYCKVLCKCDCGNYKEIRLDNLKSGSIKSCGCLRKEKLNSYKHGLRKHPLYKVWMDMKQRCYNFNNSAYKNYGDRGITVCKKWINNPKTFIEWALSNGWKKDLVIDRIDNNKGYLSDNCRFVNYGLSSRNQRLLRSDNISGYRGVGWDKASKKWKARITINNKRKYLGLFNRPRLAALRYDVEAFLLNDGRPLNFE